MPSYKTHDPKGWCGDPKRGAALGRPSINDAPRLEPITLYLRRVTIDDQGYDVNGTYFGMPNDLWWFADVEGEVDGVCRAPSREAAEGKIRKEYPLAAIKAPDALSEEQFEEFYQGYLETALFEADEGEKANASEEDREPRDLSWDDLTDGTREKLRAVCRKFWDENQADLLGFSAEHDMGLAGHCLFQAGCGSGVGFDDRYHYKDPERAVGKRLDEKSGGTTPEVYVGDDGKIHC